MLGCLTAYAAPVPPDAGQTLRELQPLPKPEAPQAAAPVVVERGSDSAPTNDVRFMVNRIDITGNKEIATAALRPLVADMVGGEHSLAELRAAVARISDYYHRRGYPVARAYLPAQEIREGAVTIAVIEGRIDKNVIQNSSRLSDKKVAQYFAHVKQGAAIKSAEIDRGLLLLNSTPGVGNSRATLQPGASVGTSELLVTVDPAAKYSADLETDNYGNRYTGQYRLGGSFNLNSPLRSGDQFTLSVLSAGSGLSYGRASYQIPVGGSGLRVGGAYFATRYKLEKDFSALQAHGDGSGGTLFAVYPIAVTQRSNLSGTLSLDQKHLIDYVDATASVTEKHVYVATLGFSAAHWDTFGGRGLTSASVSVAAGDLRIDSPIALIIDEFTAESNGRYVRYSYSLSRLQQITTRTFLSLSFSGQAANKNLDTSEKYTLGGQDGVRAYPQGEGIGDEGYLASVELRRTVTASLQAQLFYDFGSVETNHIPFQEGPNNRKLSGAGLGLNGQLAGFQIKAAVALRTDGGMPKSIPPNAVHRLNYWVQLRKAF